MTERTWANVRTALPAGLSEDSIEIIRRATAPYERVRDPAWAEYLRVCDPVWAEYERATV